MALNEFRLTRFTICWLSFFSAEHPSARRRQHRPSNPAHTLAARSRLLQHKQHRDPCHPPKIHHARGKRQQHQHPAAAYANQPMLGTHSYRSAFALTPLSQENANGVRQWCRQAFFIGVHWYTPTAISRNAENTPHWAKEMPTRRAAARQALTDREDGVPENLRSREMLKQTIGDASFQLEVLTTAYETAKTAVDETRRESARCGTAHNSALATEAIAAERTRTADNELAGRLKLAGFSGLDDFNLAKSTVAQVTEMETAVREFEAQISAAKSRVDRARESAAELELPDLAGIERELDLAKAKLSGMIAEKHQCSETSKSVDRFLDQLLLKEQQRRRNRIGSE